MRVLEICSCNDATLATVRQLLDPIRLRLTRGILRMNYSPAKMPFFVAISAYIEYLQRIWVNKLNIVTRNLRFPLLSIMLIIYTSVLIINIIPVYVLVTDISANKVFWVQEFNGWLPNKWKHSIQVARKINQELKDELPTKRILSTY